MRPGRLPYGGRPRASAAAAMGAGRAVPLAFCCHLQPLWPPLEGGWLCVMVVILRMKGPSCGAPNVERASQGSARGAARGARRCCISGEHRAPAPRRLRRALRPDVPLASGGIPGLVKNQSYEVYHLVVSAPLTSRSG